MRWWLLFVVCGVYRCTNGLSLGFCSNVRRVSTSLSAISRREALSATASIALASPSVVANAADFRPSKRATAYRVDSTIPPTLLSLDAAEERAVLSELARGSGTDKEAIVIDTVNLNNMLNKAVFGTINGIKSFIGNTKDDSKSGPGYASFVCLGMPTLVNENDVQLATSLMDSLVKGRKQSTGLALTFCPYNSQPVLDQYAQGTLSERDLLSALNQAGVSQNTFEKYLPILKFSKQYKLDLIAAALDVEDAITVRNQGLQNVDPQRRSEYVVDPQGFIQLSQQDEKFRVYSDRSLLKDYVPFDDKDSPGNFYSQRILVHEAAATACARYATTRPESLVILLAPTPDLRFLQGINGRIPRICQHILQDNNKVTNNAVTTILLNPTAADTLSASRYLRLEIGTGPETLPYQSKVADYLWFSSIPKVNMLPRLMG